jgi:hypothetical protein
MTCEPPTAVRQAPVRDFAGEKATPGKAAQVEQFVDAVTTRPERDPTGLSGLQMSLSRIGTAALWPDQDLEGRAVGRVAVGYCVEGDFAVEGPCGVRRCR